MVFAVALVCNLLWSLSYVFQKEASLVLPVALIVAIRFLLGALAMLPVLWFLRGDIYRESLGSVRPRGILGAVSIGFFCYFLSPGFQLYGIQEGRASSAGILVVTEPVFGLVLAWLFLGEVITRRVLFGLLFILSGVMILSGVLQSGRFLGGELVPNLIILTSIFLESLQGPISKKTMVSMHPFLMAFIAYLSGGVLALLWCFSVGQFPFEIKADFPWSAIFYLAFICTTTAYSLWYWVLKRMPLSKAVLFIYVQPVSASVFAWLWLGETLKATDILGGIFILVGILVAQGIGHNRQSSVSS